MIDTVRLRRTWIVVLPVGGMITLGLCGLVLLGLGAARVGPLAVLVGAFAALLPVVPVVWTFLWVDRWEPEPPRLLLLAFMWGACGATITALLINDTATVLGDTLLGKGSGNMIGALFSAPLVEEAAKGALLLALLLWRRQEFDGIVDGIVYAGLIAGGFGFTENIYYFGRAFAEGGLGSASGGVIAVFILRGLLTPFAHPLFTTMTGIGVGIAARTSSRRVRVIAPLCGYLGAVSLHALWNGSAVLGGAATFVNVYFLIMVPIFAGTVVLVLWQRRREQRVVADQLPGMAAAGWIAKSEVGLLASLTGRRGWRRAVRRRAGERAAKAVSAYQTAVTELAFLRDGIKRGKVGVEGWTRHQALLESMRAARAAAIQTPGALGAAAV